MEKPCAEKGSVVFTEQRTQSAFNLLCQLMTNLEAR